MFERERERGIVRERKRESLLHFARHRPVIDQHQVSGVSLFYHFLGCGVNVLHYNYDITEKG